MSLLGVAIGVAAVVTLTALGEGARRYVVGQFASIGTNLVIVVPGSTETTGGMPGMGGVPNDLTLEDARALLRGVPEIEKAAPMVIGTETVVFQERQRQMALIGATHEALEVRRLSVASGRFLPTLEWDRSSRSPCSANGCRALPGRTGRRDRPGGRLADARDRRPAWGLQLGVDMDDVRRTRGHHMKMLNRRSIFRLLLRSYPRRPRPGEGARRPPDRRAPRRRTSPRSGTIADPDLHLGALTWPSRHRQRRS
jgi:putative ABC transport system permease protein